MTDDRVKVGYLWDLWDRRAIRLPIAIPYLTNIHWLICGNSGSGKATLYSICFATCCSALGIR